MPLASLAIAVSIIFIAGQQPQTQPPFDNSVGSVTDVIFDPPPVAQGQTPLPSLTIVRDPVGTMTFTWGDAPTGATYYQLTFRVNGNTYQSTQPVSGSQVRGIATWAVASDGRSGTLTGLTTNTVDQLGFKILANDFTTLRFWPGPTESEVSNTAYTGVVSTSTHTPTATNTATPTPTPTNTPTPTPTATPTATPTPIPPPAQPANLSSTTCLGGIDLDWDDPLPTDPPVTSYSIEASTTGAMGTYTQVAADGTVQILIGASGNPSSARITGLSQTDTYHFRVVAVNGFGTTASVAYPALGVQLNTGGMCAVINTPTPTGTATNTPTATATATATSTPTVTPTPRPVVMCGDDCPLNGYSEDLADAVVAALDEASSYEGVTAELLRSVTVLQFQPSYLAARSDFRLMPSLERLDIRGHRLSQDPAPSFFADKGLDMLRVLHMGDRPATSAELERYRAVLPALEDLRFSGSSAPVDIFRIEPNVRTISIRTGEKVRLSVHVYGGQDKRDDSLGDADTVSFDWISDGGGSFSESAPAGRESNGKTDDRKVLHTVPDTPGTYKVTASLDGSACAGNEDQCKAEFNITVSRAIAAALSPTPVPCVLSGNVPSVLSDSSNVQYSVFTPADGGVFLSAEDGADVTAGAGSVPGCEYIGVRMDIGGDAEDLNRAGNRYTLAGDVYSVTALDSSGNEISDYEFSTPVQVCVPLPVGLRGSITELGMASINDDDSLTLLTHRIVSSSDGSIRVCGALGSLPADVAAAKRGEPESPTPVSALLSPTPESPDAGGASVPYSWVLLIAVLGVGVIMLGSATLGRRNRHLRT